MYVNNKHLSHFSAILGWFRDQHPDPDATRQASADSYLTESVEGYRVTRMI